MRLGRLLNLAYLLAATAAVSNAPTFSADVPCRRRWRFTQL